MASETQCYLKVHSVIFQLALASLLFIYFKYRYHNGVRHCTAIYRRGPTWSSLSFTFITLTLVSFKEQSIQ